MQGIPIIKLELESMKASIYHAFTNLSIETDKMVQEAVTDFCTEQNIKSIIQDQVDKTLNQAIRSAIDNYYSFGEGKKHVYALVVETLRKDQD